MLTSTVPQSFTAATRPCCAGGSRPACNWASWPSRITIRTGKLSGIGALARVLDRSRNHVVNQAIEQYLEANAWRMERIRSGIAAAQEGRVMPAKEVFVGIAAKHGWTR